MQRLQLTTADATPAMATRLAELDALYPPPPTLALAHVREFPDYYARLHQMEIVADREWGRKQ